MSLGFLKMVPTVITGLWATLILKINFKINCKNCDKVYIGQTSRALITQHCVENNHDFDLDDVKFIDRCSQWGKRLFLEAWHSIREPHSINEHVYIPDIYKALGNPK